MKTKTTPAQWVGTVDANELVATLVRIGREDRELYRLLRAEAWEMVAAQHEQQTAQQREAWLGSAS